MLFVGAIANVTTYFYTTFDLNNMFSVVVGIFVLSVSSYVCGDVWRTIHGFFRERRNGGL